MTTKNDGGPAFPMPGFTDEPGNPGRTYSPEHGMTLRDWFAGMALQGYLSAPERDDAPERVAEWAYIDADAMIAARDK